MTEPVDPRTLRASDMDRNDVAEQLRMAAGDGRLSIDELEERLETAYGAKTYGELEPLLADLPGVAPARTVAPRAPTASSTTDVHRMPVGGYPSGGAAIAIWGGAERKGAWVVPRTFQAFALMGGIELDLSEATLETETVTIIAVAFMGGIDITVPDGVAVRTEGIGIMGGFDGINDAGAVPNGPLIIVKGLAMMGGVEIKRKRPSRRERKRLEREADEQRRLAHLHDHHGIRSIPPLPPTPPAPPLPPSPPRL